VVAIPEYAPTAVFQYSVLFFKAAMPKAELLFAPSGEVFTVLFSSAPSPYFVFPVAIIYNYCKIKNKKQTI
jgi:hypothetical protein